MEDAWYLALLQTAPSWRDCVVVKLMAQKGRARQAWKASKRDLLLSGFLAAEEAEAFCRFREKIDAEIVFQGWKQQGISCLALSSPEYPALLRQIHHPPRILFIKGSLAQLPERLVAVVGSRKASPYGKNVAERLGEDLAAAGVAVVSGAARGIDSAAHRGCLQQKGVTIAVLGCGIDVAYPPENMERLNEIAATGGCVMSEYAPGTQPRPKFFPARNRIIAGLAQATIVVEANEKSGALITADMALEEGREVLAVPGSIFSPGSKGPHHLLRQGAALVENGVDVLQACGWDDAGAKAVLEGTLLDTEEEKKVWNLLSSGNLRHIDELAATGELEWTQLQYTLLCLELKGLVRKEGHRYGRTAKEVIW